MAEVRDAIWEDIRLRYLRGAAGGARSRFNARANNLWRVSQGSNAAVLKKIYSGGTHTAKQLGNQFDYLFSKATSIFGNMVSYDPDQRTLDPEDRKTIVTEWEDGWRGDPKNGHTTHLLMSFPADVAPARALKVAQIWASEMFESGEYADDEWAYVAALHTDRPHPHVHFVVNNRGIENDTWFYMAKGHSFELLAMKERMVEIAAEQGLYLDSASRIERGKLTYGPSRVELENALREGRDVHEKPLQGGAMRDALKQIRENITTLHLYSSMASQSADPELAEKIERVAEVLERGGVVNTFKEHGMDAAQVQTRGDLAQYYDKWLGSVEKDIDRLPEADRAEMRRELYETASSVSRELGDVRGAQLMQQPARDPVHAAQLSDQTITRGDASRTIGADGVAEIKDRLTKEARHAGLDPAAVDERMQRGAANAWQERDWTKQDIVTVAHSKKLDLDTEDGRTKAAGLVDAFYAKASELLDRGLDNGIKNDRFGRALSAMSESLQQTQRVEFQNDDHAGRFSKDLKERYGNDLMERLAKGDDRALALDMRDPTERRAVAQAIVAAAERHESMGMSLKQVREAQEKLNAIEQKSPDVAREQDRER